MTRLAIAASGIVQGVGMRPFVQRAAAEPPARPAFGTRCTPESSPGATMVSSEGACAAYHRYRRVGGVRFQRLSLD
jgi:hypothetical protein